jgi:hypothetical protein
MHQSLRFIARSDRTVHDQQHCYHHVSEAATAVYKLLMMGVRMAETC